MRCFVTQFPTFFSNLLDDNRFLGKIPLKPDADLRAKFFATDKHAQDVAQLRLKENPNNPNALFVMSISLGMQADYASLIDKRQLDSLKKSEKRIRTLTNC